MKLGGQAGKESFDVELQIQWEISGVLEAVVWFFSFFALITMSVTLKYNYSIPLQLAIYPTVILVG